MSRLPTPGSDDGTWGNILNDYLSQSLNTDGTLKDTAVTAAGAYSKPSGGIPSTDLDAASQANLTKASSAVQSVNGKTGSSVTLGESDIANLTTDLAAAEKTANKDQANGYAGLDGSGKLKTGEFPASVLTSSSLPAGPPDYIIQNVSNTYQAFNTVSHAVQFSSADPTVVVQSVLNALSTSGGYLY